MDTTPASLQSESGLTDICQRLTDFTSALYRSSISSPAPLDWSVLSDAIAEINALRSLLNTTVNAEAHPATVESHHNESIVQVSPNAFVLDVLHAADVSPPDG